MKKTTDDRSARRKKFKREISAGGVVYKKTRGKISVLLTMPADEGQPTGKWVLPKGWIGDHGKETMQEAALREVREEGGVNAEIEAKLGETKYTFTWEGENIFKIVAFYLMKYKSGDPKDHDQEVFEAKWFPIEEAARIMAYSGEKKIMEKAREFLAGK